MGLGSRNSLIFFVILPDGEVMPRSQSLIDAEEIPFFAATSLCNQRSSKRCFLICYTIFLVLLEPFDLISSDVEVAGRTGKCV
jgi:hypothetical protein